jgi:hypothetical protein
LTSKVSTGDFALKSVFLITGISIIGFLIWSQRRSARTRETILSVHHYVYCFGGLMVVGLVWVLTLGVFLSDVQITTDKEFYKADEPVLISVRAAGYVFRPYISKMTFGVYDRAISSDETILVKPEDHRGQDLIMVEYHSQVIGLQRVAYHSVKMVKKQ